MSSLRKNLVIIGAFWLVALTIIFLVLSKDKESSQETLNPTATPTIFEFSFDGPFVFVKEEWTAYLPMTFYNAKRNCLSRDSQKAGLAWANRAKGFDPQPVCFPDDFPWHNWNWKDGENKRNVLWGITSFERWREGTPSDYSGLVFFANEPDRLNQANMTPEEVAELAIMALEHAPHICLVGPMYSNADSGERSKQFYYEYIRLGGNPNKLCYGSLHIYPRPGGDPNNDARTRIDEYYSNYLLPTGQWYKKIFVTEIGHDSRFPDSVVLKQSTDWLCVLEDDPRIVEYYIFTTYLYGSNFAAMFEWNTGELEPLGEAARLVAGGWACN